MYGKYSVIPCVSSDSVAGLKCRLIQRMPMVITFGNTAVANLGPRLKGIHDWARIRIAGHFADRYGRGRPKSPLGVATAPQASPTREQGFVSSG